MANSSSVSDFKVIKEFWDVYNLSDGTTLKNRVILTGVKKLASSKNNKGNEYEFDFQSIQSFIFSQRSKGNPHNKFYTKQDLDASYKIDVSHSSLSEKWNEYLISDDGARLKLKSTITRVTKSDMHLQNGDPIYSVKIKILSKVIRPKT
jgi:hypothetical protein